VALLLKRIMRFAAMRTIRTVFNPDFALLEKGPPERSAPAFWRSMISMLSGRDGKAGQIANAAYIAMLRRFCNRDKANPSKVTQRLR
jgi:hypothetical protein